MERGIPIYPFYQDPLDSQLHNLESFLLKIRIQWEKGENTSELIRDHFMYDTYRNNYDNQLKLIMQILVESHDRAVKYFNSQRLSFKTQDPLYEIKPDLDPNEKLKSIKDTQESDMEGYSEEGQPHE